MAIDGAAVYNTMRMNVRKFTTPVLLLVGLVAAPVATQAEMVEEIIGWVNGEIITHLDYEDELQYRVAELYSRYTGEELDREVELVRRILLMDMIDDKILSHQAIALGYDTDKLGDWLLEQFMRTNNISDPEELTKILEQQGQGRTIEETKQQLLENGLPGQVIQSEVYNRVSVGDRELEAYYQEHLDKFRVEGEVMLREIVLLADNEEQKSEARPRAQEIWQRAASGEDFAELAREVSDAGTSEGGGEFGPLHRSDLAEMLAGPAFMLPEGSVSELMETPYGFHIIKVESRIDDYMKTLEEVRESLRRELREQKFQQEFAVYMERVRAESEWCIKPKHNDLLSIPPPPPCERL
jgi:parvulin-like peptidyl-prolyl isomerase